jgi:uncharacterized lipoprotein YehR (DUF1307 family)
MKHILPLILALIMLFSFSGCADSPDVEKHEPKETTVKQEYSYYIGNIQTKKYHKPSCSYLPYPKNRVNIPVEDIDLSQ